LPDSSSSIHSAVIFTAEFAENAEKIDSKLNKKKRRVAGLCRDPKPLSWGNGLFRNLFCSAFSAFSAVNHAS
jgi:hypothetical protein